MIAGLVDSDIRVFLMYSRAGTYDALRQIAIDGILLLGGLEKPSIVHYLASIISSDPNPFIRYYTSKSLLSFFAASVIENSQARYSAIAATVRKSLSRDEEFKRVMWEVMKYGILQLDDLQRN